MFLQLAVLLDVGEHEADVGVGGLERRHTAEFVGVAVEDDVERRLTGCMRVQEKRRPQSLCQHVFSIKRSEFKHCQLCSVVFAPHQQRDRDYDVLSRLHKYCEICYSCLLFPTIS